MNERVTCPICDADSAEQVRTSADIVKCRLCSTVYLRTRPTVAELEQHYQTYASNPGSHMKLPDTIEAAKASGLRREYFMQKIINIVGEKRGRLLDIGCGWGAFLDNARDKGFEPYGVEICDQMASYATKELNLTVHDEQLETAEWPAGLFSVVTLLHSLEHLPNQKSALKFIHSLLEPNGLICGIVPNLDSYCSSAMRESWPWLDPSMHYVHFTPSTLDNALQLCGFQLFKSSTATGDFDPKIILQQLAPQDRSSVRYITELESEGLGEEIRFFATKI